MEHKKKAPVVINGKSSLQTDRKNAKPLNMSERKETDGCAHDPRSPLLPPPASLPHAQPSHALRLPCLPARYSRAERLGSSTGFLFRRLEWQQWHQLHASTQRAARHEGKKKKLRSVEGGRKTRRGRGAQHLQQRVLGGRDTKTKLSTRRRPKVRIIQTHTHTHTRARAREGSGEGGAGAGAKNNHKRKLPTNMRKPEQPAILSIK